MFEHFDTNTSKYLHFCTPVLQITDQLASRVQTHLKTLPAKKPKPRPLKKLRHLTQIPATALTEQSSSTPRRKKSKGTKRSPIK